MLRRGESLPERAQAWAGGFGDLSARRPAVCAQPICRHRPLSLSQTWPWPPQSWSLGALQGCGVVCVGRRKFRGESERSGRERPARLLPSELEFHSVPPEDPGCRRGFEDPHPPPGGGYLHLPHGGPSATSWSGGTLIRPMGGPSSASGGDPHLLPGGRGDPHLPQGGDTLSWASSVLRGAECKCRAPC